MKPWRGFFMAALAMSLAFAAGAAELKDGLDFRLVDPPVAAPRDRIEVTEFFWYGCPHCADFEPVLAAWTRKLPADVGFRRVPAISANDKWVPAARIFYTLEAMGLVEKFHAEVFAAIHAGHLNLFDEKVLFEWAAKKGIDPKKFGEAWTSPDVQGRIQRARELTRSSGVAGVPVVMVQGRYLALTQGNYEELLATVEKLVERARKEAGGR